ncbi:hypothetical protein P167DRAFT_574864 [Morchella conica CCBAS932]|uniref:Uncharacterized protein n=1 Tax=Morchella conica CCBAS932 TaxID=1392247 RepID=A0A3N4KMX9_9PEZI|nr:hypothetical protein P167DRAFT_574864 [Morchella conica CCBAS932]
MMPELSLLSESAGISGWLHQFSGFNCGTTLQVFVPIAGETPITKAAGSPSQGIYPPKIEGDFNKTSVLSQFTDQPGRPNQLVEFNSSGPSFQGSVPMTERAPRTGDLGSPLKKIDLSKGNFDRSRGMVADETTETKGQGAIMSVNISKESYTLPASVTTVLTNSRENATSTDTA